MALTARQLNRATLDRQLLLERQVVPVVEAIRTIMALQAQEPASPHLALWNRVADFDPAELNAAFTDNSVVKASLMRITLHAVAADDYTTFHQAMVDILRASRLNDKRYTSTGLKPVDADAVAAALVEFASVETRSKADIERELARLVGAEPEPRLWWALRTFAPLGHAPTGGPWSFGRHPSYRAAPAEPARPDTGEALRRLILRYLGGFGPATVSDFAQFTMLRKSNLNPAVTALIDDGMIVTLKGPDDVELLDLPGATCPAHDIEAPPRLLGMWDSTLLAYADRSRIVPDQYRKAVIRRNGDVLPTVLVDGQVCGVWRTVTVTTDLDAPVDPTPIEVMAFHRLDHETWQSVADEAERLGRLLAGRDPYVYRRYHRWWESLPDGEVHRFNC